MKIKGCVSVIMPFLNTERFIEEAIQSVVAQTYPDWELLLVDDGSTDRSTAIAQRAALTHPARIKYLEHERHQNRGASASRNLALACAKGEFVAFLDSDDVFLPDNLRHQVGLMMDNPGAGTVCSSTEFWYSWNPAEPSREDYVERALLPTGRLYSPPELLVRLVIRQHAPTPCTCSLLVREELMRRVKGFNEAFRYIYTDQVLHAKLFMAAPVYVSGRCVARYRQHGASCCHVAAQTGTRANVRSQFLKWLEQYMTEQGCDSTFLNREIRRAIWLHRHPALDRVQRSIGRRLSAAGVYPACRARLAVPGP